ncbi:hypothetical protein EPI10_023155 [Gossypium australe]|uniref:Uncharacterized protein n=1 Tax=Gossypium australe TaxID=47621 RepID=A0A5B6VUM2_9ROSI|nr:hypothetical protein EPI10_023155 [Gossypium australe]
MPRLCAKFARHQDNPYRHEEWFQDHNHSEGTFDLTRGVYPGSQTSSETDIESPLPTCQPQPICRRPLAAQILRQTKEG